MIFVIERSPVAIGDGRSPEVGTLAHLRSPEQPGRHPARRRRVRHEARAKFGGVTILQPAGYLGRIARSSRRLGAGVLAVSVALTLTACGKGGGSTVSQSSGSSGPSGSSSSGVEGPSIKPAPAA